MSISLSSEINEIGLTDEILYALQGEGIKTVQELLVRRDLGLLQTLKLDEAQNEMLSFACGMLNCLTTMNKSNIVEKVCSPSSNASLSSVSNNGKTNKKSKKSSSRKITYIDNTRNDIPAEKSPLHSFIRSHAKMDIEFRYKGTRFNDDKRWRRVLVIGQDDWYLYAKLPSGKKVNYSKEKIIEYRELNV